MGQLRFGRISMARRIAAMSAAGTLAIACAIVVGATNLGFAETAERPQPRDAAAVQNCLKSQRGRELMGERCIGVVADPCLKGGGSTADRNGCADRERL